jgi:lipoprotein-releasing system ATP-binding protein
MNDETGHEVEKAGGEAAAGDHSVTMKAMKEEGSGAASGDAALAGKGRALREKAGEAELMRLEGLELSYSQGDRRIDVLRGASASFRRGEAIALVGPSGAGKSSLLHIVGLLDRPDNGRIVFEGRDCVGLNDRERTMLRRAAIGFVYQFHQLLPEFSALENVMLPQLIFGAGKRRARERAQKLLDSMGLGERAVHRPAELSGGEQQRVAIARAVANRPKILLADEPTGNLDPSTAERVFAQLLALVRTTGLCAIMATHNMELAERMDRVMRLEEGLLREVGA